MSDATYSTKVYTKQGGDTLVVASGGVLDIETGGIIKTNGTQGAPLTTQLTTITPADAEGTPDYAINGVITGAGAYGTSTAQELITLLYVIKNLQVRMAEVEARLEAAGFVAAN
jgi:hypothetical protein